MAKNKNSGHTRKSLEERRAIQAETRKQKNQSFLTSLLNITVLVAVCLFIVFFFNKPRSPIVACIVITVLIIGIVIYGTYQRLRQGLIQSMKEWYVPFWSNSLRQIISVITAILLIVLYCCAFAGKFS